MENKLQFNDILLYMTENTKRKIELIYENETFWFSQTVSIPNWCNYKMVLRLLLWLWLLVSIPNWCNYKLFAANTNCRSLKFQSQTGAIISLVSEFKRVLQNKFQSQTGAIISTFSNTIIIFNFVSIPNWCNYKPCLSMCINAQKSFNPKLVQL